MKLRSQELSTMKLYEFLENGEHYDKAYHNGEKLSREEMDSFLDNEIDIEEYQDYDGCDEDGADIIRDIVIIYIKDKGE